MDYSVFPRLSNIYFTSASKYVFRLFRFQDQMTAKYNCKIKIYINYKIKFIRQIARYKRLNKKFPRG